MSESTAELLSRFDAILKTAKSMAIPVRDREVISEHLLHIEAFLSELKVAREARITEGGCDDANLLLGLCCLTESYTNLISMWLSIRDDDATEAWDLFVGAEKSARYALRSHAAVFEEARAQTHRLELIETLVFPKISFVSSSFVAKPGLCSICRQPYDVCDHLAGMPYCGSFCIECGLVPIEVDHVALVERPENKRCRVTKWYEENFEVDVLTLKRNPIEPSSTRGNCEAILLTED